MAPHSQILVGLEGERKEKGKKKESSNRGIRKRRVTVIFASRNKAMERIIEPLIFTEEHSYFYTVM